MLALKRSCRTKWVKTVETKELLFCSFNTKFNFHIESLTKTVQKPLKFGHLCFSQLSMVGCAVIGQPCQSLAEMPAQSGGAIVYSQLNESVEEVSVKVGQLLSRAHLLEVVRGNNQEVTQSMKRVKELEHERNLWRVLMQLLVCVSAWLI